MIYSKKIIQNVGIRYGTGTDLILYAFKAIM